MSLIHYKPSQTLPSESSCLALKDAIPCASILSCSSSCSLQYISGVPPTKRKFMNGINYASSKVNLLRTVVSSCKITSCVFLSSSPHSAQYINVKLPSKMKIHEPNKSYSFKTLPSVGSISLLVFPVSQEFFKSTMENIFYKRDEFFYPGLTMDIHLFSLPSSFENY